MKSILDYVADLEQNLNQDSICSYLDVAKNLMYQDEDVVRLVVEKLKNSIFNFSSSRCSLNFKKILEKKDLENKSNWYINEISDLAVQTSTSGSTTGVPFEYLRFVPVFEKIEWDYHYNLVLDEFGIEQSPSILYMMPHNYRRENNKYVVSYGSSSELNIVNHGNKRTPIIHYVDFEAYKNDRENFFEYLFSYLRENKIDVFYTSAPEINSLCSYAKKHKISDKLGFLLSSTNEKLLANDAKFILENNLFDHICDHMKCWDGGAAFFTCKHKTYHLMDEVCWVESIDGKLVSTDYFNLCSPFVRYWNGDYCSIGAEYKRCDCGRLYREFEFIENRPFSLKGVCLKNIKDNMKKLDIKGIKQVRCAPEYLDVITDRELSIEEKQAICLLSEKFKFRFSVEL